MARVTNKRRERYQILKQIVYDVYGRTCKHCKEDDPDVLTIDHVNNDGAQHRGRLGGNQEQGGRADCIYRDAIVRGFPKDYMVLCMSCNVAKHKNGGRLPRNRRNKYA